MNLHWEHFIEKNMQYLNTSLCVMWVYETVYCGSYLILAPTPHSWKECTGKGFIGFCAMGCTCSIFHYSICDNYTCSGIVIPTTRLVMYRYAPSLNYLHAIKSNSLLVCFCVMVSLSRIYKQFHFITILFYHFYVLQIRLSTHAVWFWFSGPLDFLVSSIFHT